MLTLTFYSSIDPRSFPEHLNWNTMPPLPSASSPQQTPDTPWSYDAPLRDVPAAVTAFLTTSFQESHSDFDDIHPIVADAISELAEFTLGGGKRVRPVFMWAGIRAGLAELAQRGTTPSDLPAPAQLLAAISSLELIQAAALIHDDIIDASESRRGAPTVHRTYRESHAQQSHLGDSQHYGESVAILIGDLALTWADDILRSARLPLWSQRSLALPWRRMRTEVIAGQILDIAVEASGSEALDDALTVTEYKTASYTVAGPLALGASLIGGSVELVEELRTIGRDLGIAFQLRDDQLGVFGDPEVTGKPSGDDLRSGKRTALIISALDTATPQQAQRLRDKLGNVDGDEIDELRRIITDSGALATVEAMIEEYTSAAVARIRALTGDDSLRTELLALADKLTHRRS